VNKFRHGSLLALVTPLDKTGDPFFEGEGFNYADDNKEHDFWMEYSDIVSITYIKPQEPKYRPCRAWHVCVLSTISGENIEIELHESQFDLPN
jgi:hypothetical protein